MQGVQIWTRAAAFAQSYNNPNQAFEPSGVVWLIRIGVLLLYQARICSKLLEIKYDGFLPVGFFQYEAFAGAGYTGYARPLEQ